MKDKRPIYAMRIKGTVGLYPYTVADEAAFRAIKEGERVEISFKKRKRTADQNAAYWSMLQRVIDATDAFPDTDHFHDALKMDLGVTELRKTLGGDVYMIPGRTSTMDTPTFMAFFAKAEKLIAEKFGIDVVELRKEAA